MKVKFLSPQELSPPVLLYCKRAAKNVYTETTTCPYHLSIYTRPRALLEAWI